MIPSINQVLLRVLTCVLFFVVLAKVFAPPSPKEGSAAPSLQQQLEADPQTADGAVFYALNGERNELVLWRARAEERLRTWARAHHVQLGTMVTIFLPEEHGRMQMRVSATLSTDHPAPPP